MQSTSPHHAAIHTVLRTLRDNPSHASLSTLADIAALSPFHFHRIFKQRTGRTPATHTRHLRLLRAAICLRTSKTPIVTIALDAHYQNHESFSRAFSNQFGCAPRAYRIKHQPKPGAPMKSLNPALQLVKIPVTDFNRACAFYRDTLGLEEEFAVEAYGWAQYKAGPVPLCLYTVGMGGGDGTPGHDTNLHLAVDDAAKAFALLKSRGATLPTPLVPSDDGTTFFTVADPDHNTIKIIQRT